MTRVEANVDLKRQGPRVLEGCLQEQRVLGASAATPSNNQLLREFKDEGYKGAHTQEWCGDSERSNDKGESSRLKLGKKYREYCLLK